MNDEMNNNNFSQEPEKTADEPIMSGAPAQNETPKAEPAVSPAGERPSQSEVPPFSQAAQPQAQPTQTSQPQTSQPDYRSAYGSTYTPYGSYNGAAANNGGYRGYTTGQCGTYYGGAPTMNTTPVGGKKAKKAKGEHKGTRAVAWLCAACVLCSALFGFGGVYLGSRLFSDNSSTVQYSEGDFGKGTINYTSGESTSNKTSDGTIASAASIAADSVVEITTEKVATSAFYGQYVTGGAGSGVIIDTDGYIITCAHVVEGATSVTVRLTNGDSFDAKVVGSDSQTDIAVIKIDATGLVAAKVGNSDEVVVGETAIAIGNPLGTLGGTVSSGIISSLNREITIDGQNYTLLQIDTSINPGNSGGGLFDIDGNLIGVVNAKSSGSSGSSTSIEGLGFAIPINKAIDVAEQLTEKGYVSGRVNLGVYVCEVNSNTSMTTLYQKGYSELINYITDYGVYFLGYQDGQNGDLKYGDRIIAVDDISVSTRSDIISLLEDYSIGDTVKVSVSRLNSDRRRSQVVDVDITLVEYVPDTGSDSAETTIAG